jgi:hypothetical protein
MAKYLSSQNDPFETLGIITRLISFERTREAAGVGSEFASLGERAVGIPEI